MCQIGLEHLAKVSGVLDITQPLDEGRGTGLLDKLMHVLQYRDDKGIKDGKGGKKLYNTKDSYRLVTGNKPDGLVFEKNTKFLSRKRISLEDKEYRNNKSL